MTAPPLEGTLVRLRDWRDADVPALRGWLRPHHEWHRWNAPYFGRPTDEEADRMCQGIVATELRTPRPTLAIAGHDGDRLLGSVSWYWESEETNWRRVGIVLYDPASWSGGRGTEALTLWTSYLFATTDVVRLDYATWSGNERMCRLGEKLGWTLEARFRQARIVDGRHYDSVVYGVLRDEWAARLKRLANG